MSSMMVWKEAPSCPQWKRNLVSAFFLPRAATTCPAVAAREDVVSGTKVHVTRGDEIMSNCTKERALKLGNSDIKNDSNTIGDDEIKSNLIHAKTKTKVKHNVNAEVESSEEDTGLGSDESEGEARDEGRRAVSIVITSGHGRPALAPSAAELAALAGRLEELRRLAAPWRPRSLHTSSPGRQVRLDAIFRESGQARGYFKAVQGANKRRAGPALTACNLVGEAELGHSLPPVLTEHLLLLIQADQMCRNVFLTSLPITVTLCGGMVEYTFLSVADANMFLFRKVGCSAGGRARGRGKALGRLWMTEGAAPRRRLVAGRGGRFALVTEDRNLPAEVAAYPGIHITPVTSALATIGHTLAFAAKLDLFRFLVSSEAALLRHLQFQEELVAPDKAEEAPGEVGETEVAAVEELETKKLLWLLEAEEKVKKQLVGDFEEEKKRMAELLEASCKKATDTASELKESKLDNGKLLEQLKETVLEKKVVVHHMDGVKLENTRMVEEVEKGNLLKTHLEEQVEELRLEKQVMTKKLSCAMEKLDRIHSLSE